MHHTKIATTAFAQEHNVIFMINNTSACAVVLGELAQIVGVEKQ